MLSQATLTQSTAQCTLHAYLWYERERGDGLHYSRYQLHGLPAQRTRSASRHASHIARGNALIPCQGSCGPLRIHSTSSPAPARASAPASTRASHLRPPHLCLPCVPFCLLPPARPRMPHSALEKARSKNNLRENINNNSSSRRTSEPELGARGTFFGRLD
ncbi:hypothetical protein M758_5G087800 [Ceratodon purpureus]|nr:hypothetical protein M758_5G087800 [Ceratodon purpureus]